MGNRQFDGAAVLTILIKQLTSTGGVDIMIMKKAALLCLVFCLFGTSYGLIDCFWRPTSGTLWSTAANWNNNDVPDSLKPGATDAYKAYFLNNWDECVLNYDGPTINNLHLDQSKPLRIVEGGRLTVMDWAILSYSNPGGRIVVDGGTLDCRSHLFIGPWAHNYGHAYGASVEQNGGTVTVAGVFGPGVYGGRGHYQLNGGTLFANGSWELNSEGGAGSMDVTEGVFVKSGDVTAQISNEIVSGRLTAYGGMGKFVYDYGVTHPGKTTLKAIPPIPGDFDNDFDVDIADLEIFAAEWLLTDCESIANFDEWCKVDYRDFAVFAANWLCGTNPRWHVVQTQYPTDDWIVAPFHASTFGIVGDGVTDVTDAIQSALIAVSNIGGGALFLPSGHYKITGNLVVPSCVTLRGDWQTPDPDGPVTGTVLMAYAGRGQNDDEGTPFIGLSNGSGVKGLTIWYPEQTYDNIQPYPPSIRRVGGSNHSVENVTFVNSYIGFSNYSDQITASPFLRNIYGTPLKTGIEFDCLADVGRIETVHFSPYYWKNSGLPGAPVANQHAQWLYGQATGLVLGRIDWSYAAYVTVEGYYQGLLLHPTRNPNNPGSTPNGQCYAFDLKNCRTGVYVENSASVGFMFTRFNIDQAQTGMYFAPTANGVALIHTSEINAINDAVNNAGPGKIQAISCNFKNGQIKAGNGYLSIINSDFNSAAGTHLTIGSSVRGTTLQGNRFSRTAQIIDATPSYYPVLIDHSAVTAASLPAYDFKKPTQAYTAAKTDVFVVTDAPYNAAADHSSDATAAFQAALADAGDNGGGIVFVPAGDYRLDGTLIVPTGVELRGVYDLAYSPSARGTVLNTYFGKNQENGTPFIQIQSNAGIRGLTIHHAGQIYDFNDPVNFGITPYPFAIRGLGSDVYVISIAMTIPWQVLDLATYRCDRHYVDNILGTAMKTGIHVGGGSVDGRVYNCQFNPSAYVFQRQQYSSIPNHGDIGGVYDIAWRQATPYRIGNVTGQVLHQNFVFGGWKGAHFVNEGGYGPSGYCLGLGIDQCTTSLRVDDIGEGGMDLINSQIVTVDYENGSYLVTDADLADTFRMFSTCCWGGSEKSMRINGGHVELQLCQIESWGWVVDTPYTVVSGAHLRTIGCNVTEPVNQFLQLDSNGSFESISNLIRINSSGMPVDNGTNLRARGNLRIQ